MDVITPEDFPGVAEDVARRIIVAARSIAPCIDSFEDETENKKNALAILRGVAAEAPKAGSRRVKDQSIGPARVSYWDAKTWSDEDKADLRSLCTRSAPSGAPRGSFPRERPVSRLWPETYA